MKAPALLDPELEKIAGKWDGETRLRAAEVYERWAAQLRASAGAPPIQERAADWIWSNYYVKLGFTKDQVKLLGELGRSKLGFKKAPVANAARWLVLAGLADLDAAYVQLANLLHEHETESLQELNQKLNQVCAEAAKPLAKAEKKQAKWSRLLSVGRPSCN